MAKAPYRKPALRDLSGVSREELEELIIGLVERGDLPAETVHCRLDDIRELAGERAKLVLDRDKYLTTEQQEQLLITVKARFEDNTYRHESIEWAKVQSKLEANPQKMWSLNEMERTGGEPDVVGYYEKTGEYIFYDCSMESPEGRRNICYDREGQEVAERRGSQPNGNAVDIAAAMGIEILTPDQYREFLDLEGVGKEAWAWSKTSAVDRETWTWLKTSAETRESGVALRGHRFDRGMITVSHTNAFNHDVSGAFRGSLRV